MKKFLLVLVTAVGAAAVSAEAQGAEGRAGPLGRGHGQGLTLVPGGSTAGPGGVARRTIEDHHSGT